ncbi:MAG: HrcA family transcriptional regulator, partial [Nodosilinea sp.]
TSAGRVPSDFGYRLYVDRLMLPSARVGRRVDAALSEELNWVGRSLESLLRSATQILAQISGCLALITVPQSSTAIIRHIQLVAVDGEQVLMVVLLDSLATQSMVVQLPAVLSGSDQTMENLSSRHLEILSNFLSQHLRGRSPTDVTTLNWGDLDAELQHYGALLCEALDNLAQRSRVSETPQLVISGLSEVLRQPEFSDAQRIQSIVKLLEEDQSQLWPLFDTPPVASQTLNGVNVKVWIGAENPLEPMQSCALVVSNYTCCDAVGSVGVLGPTRMVYENAVAVVKAAADYMSTALT